MRCAGFTSAVNYSVQIKKNTHVLARKHSFFYAHIEHVSDRWYMTYIYVNICGSFSTMHNAGAKRLWVAEHVDSINK